MILGDSNLGFLPAIAAVVPNIVGGIFGAQQAGAGAVSQFATQLAAQEAKEARRRGLYIVASVVAVLGIGGLIFYASRRKARA